MLWSLCGVESYYGSIDRARDLVKYIFEANFVILPHSEKNLPHSEKIIWQYQWSNSEGARKTPNHLFLIFCWFHINNDDITISSCSTRVIYL